MSLPSLGQLKNQVITLEAVSKDLKTLNLSDKMNVSNTKEGTIETKISPGLILAGTNILVNSLTRILKKQLIDNKTIAYSTALSGENFYTFSKDSSEVYQGIDFFLLKRIRDKNTELEVELSPVFSADKNFFKWKLNIVKLTKGGFKKTSKNVDIEFKINFQYYKQATTSFTLTALKEQIITVYAAQNKEIKRVNESEWMPIPSFGIKSEIFSPAFMLKIDIKEMTSIPEIYKEIIKEEEPFKKSLRDLINNITNSFKPKE